MEESVTQERLHQIRRELKMTRGAQIAGAAASGVKTTSRSVLAVMADTAAQYQRELNVTEEVGASRTAAALERGRLTGERAKYSSYATAMGMFGSAASDIYSIWRKRGSGSE